MLIEQAKNRREDIIAILIAEKLPADDLPATLEHFFVAIENGEIAGVAGLEMYSVYGLLRSLAVPRQHRNKGIAGELIKRLEGLAVSRGLKALYLLTETAPGYFAGKGFQIITRDEVPGVLKQSSEFSHVCPVSAIVMKKTLIG